MNDFWKHFGNKDFKNAAKALSALDEETQATILEGFYQHGGDAQKAYAVSVLIRKLKPENSIEDFQKAWLPPENLTDKKESGMREFYNYYPVPTRVFNAVSMHDEKEILSIGLMWMKEEDWEKTAMQAHKKEQESGRREKIAKVTDDPVKISVYKVVGDFNFGTEF